MPSLNDHKKEPECYKVLYFGAAGAGKRTNLEFFKALPKASAQAIAGEPGVFCVNLSVEAGLSKPFALYTASYAVSSPLWAPLLRDLHGLVFVVDSSPEQYDNNVLAMAAMINHLSAYRIRIDNFPAVIQYNKRDLEHAVMIQRFEDELNPLGLPAFNAVAKMGAGVVASLQAVRLLIGKHSRS